MERERLFISAKSTASEGQLFRAHNRINGLLRISHPFFLCVSGFLDTAKPFQRLAAGS